MHWNYLSLYFFSQWLLHVSAKQCHPQGANMFLSEPLPRQYGRRQVIGHMTEPTYRRAIQHDGTYIPACYRAWRNLHTGVLYIMSEPSYRRAIQHDGTYIPACYTEWRNLHTGVLYSMTEPTYRRAIQHDGTYIPACYKAWRNLHTGVLYSMTEPTYRKIVAPWGWYCFAETCRCHCEKNKEIYNFSAFGWLISTYVWTNCFQAEQRNECIKLYREWEFTL
jgi:hypothetical protein